MTMKFKNLGGPHVEQGKQIGVNPETKAPVYAEVTYERGQVVETDIDLAAKFNVKGAPAMAKFQRLSDASKATYKPMSRFNTETTVPEAVDDTEASEDEDLEEHLDEDEEEAIDEADEEGGIGNDTLSTMTVDELRRHAEANMIDLSGCKTKAQILARLRGSN